MPSASTGKSGHRVGHPTIWLATWEVHAIDRGQCSAIVRPVNPQPLHYAVCPRENAPTAGWSSAIDAPRNPGRYPLAPVGSEAWDVQPKRRVVRFTHAESTRLLSLTDADLHRMGVEPDVVEVESTELDLFDEPILVEAPDYTSAFSRLWDNSLWGTAFPWATDPECLLFHFL